MKKGARVKYSQIWLMMTRKHKKHTAKRGKFIGMARDGRCVRVLWDGIKTIERYAPEFIIPAPKE